MPAKHALLKMTFINAIRGYKDSLSIVTIIFTHIHLTTVTNLTRFLCDYASLDTIFCDTSEYIGSFKLSKLKIIIDRLMAINPGFVLFNILSHVTFETRRL